MLQSAAFLTPSVGSFPAQPDLRLFASFYILDVAAAFTDVLFRWFYFPVHMLFSYLDYKFLKEKYYTFSFVNGLVLLCHLRSSFCK